MDLYTRLPVWAKRTFFPTRHEEEQLILANRDAYIAANESLMSWVFTMHGYYHGLARTMGHEQEQRELSFDEHDQLALAKYYMVEFEDLGVYIASFPEGTWVRMHMVDTYIRGRLRQLPKDAADEHVVVLQELTKKFDKMLRAVPAYAR